MSTSPLGSDEVEHRLTELPGWQKQGAEISKRYTFPDFISAIKFVNLVAEAAEIDQHHPDILIQWNKVTLTLTTHDAGGLTFKDFDLAADSERLARSIQEVG